MQAANSLEPDNDAPHLISCLFFLLCVSASLRFKLMGVEFHTQTVAKVVTMDSQRPGGFG
jgi:hypothetical protein